MERRNPFCFHFDSPLPPLQLTGLARMYQNPGRSAPAPPAPAPAPARTVTSVLDFTNLPVRFSPNAGTTLPAGLSPDTEYFLRPVPGGYAVATSTSGLPLSTIAAMQSASFSFSSSYHGASASTPSARVFVCIFGSFSYRLNITFATFVIITLALSQFRISDACSCHFQMAAPTNLQSLPCLRSLTHKTTAL